MDAVMPGNDGFETTRLLKRDDELSHVPIVFMTGLSETEHVVKGLEAGGVDYVTKPMSPDALIARIRVHLANARAAQSARVGARCQRAAIFWPSTPSGEVLWCTPQARRLLGPRAALAPEPFHPAARRARLDQPGSPARAMSRRRSPPMPAPGTAGLVPGPHRPGRVHAPLTEENTAGARGGAEGEAGADGREAEVLVWLARGKSNKDIAEILTLSPRTVNKHLEQIYAKLGVENRASAAAIAMRAWPRTRRSLPARSRARSVRKPEIEPQSPGSRSR